jgi:hypothetical protein
MPAGPAAGEIPASVSQRLVWAMARRHPGASPLICPLVCHVRGPVTPAALAAAVAGLVAQHEALRTEIRQHLGLVQVIHPHLPISVDHADLSRHGAVLAEAEAERQLAAELRTPMPPSSRLARARIWTLAPDWHLLCLNVHHLVTDLWSSSVLLDDLAELLGGAVADPARPQFRTFAAWQAEELRSRGTAHVDYWSTRLAGAELVDLGLAPNGPGDGAGERRVEATLPAEVSSGLQAIAARSRTTLFAVLAAVFFTTARRITGQRDLTVASLYANRTRPELRRVVGCLTNMVLLRARLPDEPGFDGAVGVAHETVMGALAHQQVPYHALPRSCAPAGGGVADVVFQAAADPIEQVVGIGDIELESVVPDVGSRFDVELAVMARADTVAIKLFYRRTRLADGAARELIGAFADTARLAAGRDG